MHHVISRRKLTENEARYYIAETILGLDAIHRENYIYRDLKPENILLDLDGHIRITDFGLVKKVDNSKALNHTYCGTYEVMAPEILADQGYNFMVDYYNIGTLAYELVTGKIPRFSGEKRVFLEEKNPAIQCMSADFRDFIMRLLDTNPRNRLGAIGGLKEICSHPWLSSINMSQLNERKVKPPVILDPNFIHFKSKSPISEDIDRLDWESMPLQTSLDNTLVNFSFYGIEEISATLRLIPSIEKNSGSKFIGGVAKKISPSLFQTLSTDCVDGITKTNLCLEKNEEVEEELRFTEMDETESVTAKFANYKLKVKTSFSIIKKIALNVPGKCKKTHI